MKINILLALSCQGDISLIELERNKAEDTSSEIISDTTSEDTQDVDTEEIEYDGVSGFFNYKLQQVACPACLGLNREITVSAESFFHEPISDSHFDNYLQPGNCSTQYHSYRPSYNKMYISDQLFVDGPQHDFYINSASDLEFLNNQLYESQYDRDAAHKVYTNEVDYFSFQSIHGFDFIEPYEMLYVDPSYAYAAMISRSGQTFYWGPSGSEYEFEISLEVFSYDGSSFLGLVTCSGLDSGSINVPGNMLSSFPQHSLVAIILTRHKRDKSEFDLLCSYIETHMEWQVIGTGYIY